MLTRERDGKEFGAEPLLRHQYPVKSTSLPPRSDLLRPCQRREKKFPPPTLPISPGAKPWTTSISPTTAVSQLMSRPVGRRLSRYPADGWCSGNRLRFNCADVAAARTLHLQSASTQGPSGCTALREPTGFRDIYSSVMQHSTYVIDSALLSCAILYVGLAARQSGRESAREADNSLPTTTRSLLTI